MSLLSKHVISATVMTDPPIELDIRDGRVALDDSWSPYVQATLTVPLPSEEDLEAIDPRSSIRVEGELVQSFEDWNSFGYRAPESRTFDLLLVGRTVNHETKRMTLELESDEALLRLYGLISSTPERTYGLSVRDAVEYVLDKIGATLEPGAPDADLESDALPPVATNLIVNPSAEVNTTNAAGGNCTLTRDTGWAVYGSASFKLASPTVADCYLAVGGGTGALRNGMVAGYTYTASGTIRLTAPLGGTPDYRARRIEVGAVVGGVTLSLAMSDAAPNVAGETRLSITYMVPSNATEVWIRWYHGHTSGDVWWDALRLSEDRKPSLYFDGSTSGGYDANLYTVAWDGTAHNSSSTLTPVPATDATIWEPGQSAWDWLKPLTQATNLQLYCDEQRRWWLIESGASVDGLVQLGAEQNVTRATDEIALLDNSSYYTGVVLKYTWTDADKVRQVAYDVAGTPGKVWLIEYDRAYPGPGAAAYVLARAEGRGRVFDLEAMSSYMAEPRRTLVATLANTPTQTGRVSAVEWSFPSGRMRVKSRGLVDTPDDAWLLAVGGWDDQSVGTDWTEYTP